MDKKRERNYIMVKILSFLAMVASASLVCGAHGESITNISQCMNANLTSEILERFPANPTSSVQNCVLAFIKGSVNGDLRTFAAPFSDEIRISEFGISNIDSIPASASDEFSALMSSISNCTSKVISYGEITNNGTVKASVTLHRQGVLYNRNEVVHLDMSQTNQVWRIANWEVDE